MRAVKHFLDFVFWGFVARMLPGGNLKFVFSLGRIIGRVFYVLAGKRKETITQELKLVLPEKSHDEIEDITKRTFLDFFMSQTEELHFPHLTPDNVDNLIKIEGREHLDAALEKGTGVIALHAHYGSYMLIMPALGYNGYKINQIAFRENPPPEIIAKMPECERKGLDFLAHKLRCEHFQDCLPVNFINAVHAASLRAIFDRTKQNEIVAVAGDGRGAAGNDPSNFVPVDLCGRQALLSTGGYRMAARTGAVLLPMFIVRQDDLSHRLVVHEPIDVKKDASVRELQGYAQSFADIFTDYIRRYPHHYALFFWRMRMNAHWDDHPFFPDYAVNDDWRKYLIKDSQD